MSLIVGVHGVGKQQRGRHQLRDAWKYAVADGLERASGGTVTAPDLDIAFYGDLVWPQSSRDTKAPAGELEVLGDLSDDECDELESSLREVVSDHEIAEARQAPPPKGYTR